MTLSNLWRLTEGGPIVVNSNGEPVRCSECPCLCSGSIADWELSETGFEGSDPWTVGENNLTLRLDFEDSQDCGGSNPNSQSGTASSIITTTCPLTMKISWYGQGEAEDPGYETLGIVINGVTVVQAATDGSGGAGCGPVPTVPEGGTTNPQEVELPLGESTIDVTMDTIDAAWHQDAYYEITFEFLVAG